MSAKEWEDAASLDLEVTNKRQHLCAFPSTESVTVRADRPCAFLHCKLPTETRTSGSADRAGRHPSLYPEGGGAQAGLVTCPGSR